MIFDRAFRLDRPIADTGLVGTREFCVFDLSGLGTYFRISEVSPRIEPLCLAGDGRPVEQMATLLGQAGPSSRVHLVATGEPGSLRLAGGRIDAGVVHHAWPALADLRRALFATRQVVIHAPSAFSGRIGHGFGVLLCQVLACEIVVRSWVESDAGSGASRRLTLRVIEGGGARLEKTG